MVDVNRDELSELAAEVFHGEDTAEIPEKIWCHAWQSTLYVCVAWADGVTSPRADNLEKLRDLLAKTYGVETVAVGYWRDLAWEECDRLAARLQARG